ncbi:excalibur calcium-binding domain-containing protein [Caulobacter segnis]|uniref:excalibur calcium-binding domain-containing protein n=1 Tax=Caulobacter segnis TaxID=88688 RepID=UPI00321F94C6
MRRRVAGRNPEFTVAGLVCHVRATSGGSMVNNFASYSTLYFCAVGVLLLSAGLAHSHPGGLNAEGCHNDRKRGGYHCHRASTASSRAAYVTPIQAAGGGGRFRNCSEARAAGAAPVYRGSPGYGRHLDRDGDGVGCER